jgi:hypothetical protein
VFGNPLVAAALGALLGALLTFVSHRASAFVTPNDPMRGMAIYGFFMIARMLSSLLALGVYFVAAPDGLAPFGFALGLSFIAGLAFEAVKVSRLDTSRTSA